jgi:uncharacterized protein
VSRVAFDYARPLVESDPARTDIACFVGLARAIAGAVLPAAIEDWLEKHGWTDGSLARSTDPPFTDIPIPIETYATFTSLFDPGGSASSYGTDYLATAVRSFFAQGGRRCYVVRMGDPVSPEDDAVAQNGLSGKAQKLAAVLPGSLYAPDDRRSWHGVGHLGGLPDVSFLALPDLPVLCGSAPTAAIGVTPVVAAGPSQFVECSQLGSVPGPTPVDTPPAPRDTLPAPRLTQDDYGQRWAPSVDAILTYLRQSQIREIQFVAAFPLPQDLDAAAAVENPDSAELAQDIHDVIQDQMPENISGGTDVDPPADPGLSTAFLQLTYPWLKTTGSYVLNESLEPPDGALVGILARNALTRGSFMNATKIVPAEISDVWPPIPAQDTQVPSTALIWGANSPVKPLIIRLSLFGFTPAGLRLLSDVTAYPGETYRPACVHRLVSVILRASRQLGERITFAQNGPALWRRVENSLGQLMTQLWLSNALDGASIQQAFSVRCDASTMMQNDLDNGRLIALVTFNAAASVELIQVTLALETSGASAQGIAAMAQAS